MVRLIQSIIASVIVFGFCIESYATPPTISLVSGKLKVEHALSSSTTTTNVEIVVVGMVNHVKVSGLVGSTPYSWQTNIDASGVDASSVTSMEWIGSDGDDTATYGNVTTTNFPNISATTYDKVTFYTHNGGDHIQGSDLCNKIDGVGPYVEYHGGSRVDRITCLTGKVDAYTYGGGDLIIAKDGSYIDSGAGDDNITVTYYGGDSGNVNIFIFAGTGADVVSVSGCTEGSVYAGMDSDNDELTIGRYEDIYIHYDDGEDEVGYADGNFMVDDQ